MASLFIMDRIIVKVFVIVLICLSFIECYSVDLSEKTNATVEVDTSPNTTITNESSTELQNLVDKPIQINERSSSGIKQLGAVVSNKQIPGLPDIPPFVETLRRYFKMAYKSFILFQPEIKFGQCLIKYFYMRFPSTMRLFQLPNLTKYIRRMYSVSGRMTNNIVTRTIFSFFDDTELDRERIAIKMATMTDAPLTPFQKTAKPILEFYEIIQSPSAQFFPDLPQLPVFSEPIQLTRRRRRFQRQANYPNERNASNMIDRWNQIQYKNNMKREPRQSTNDGSGEMKSKDPAEIDPNETIDLTNKDVEREAEELFTIDTMFWKSLGFEDSSFKKYSLAYCTREYVTNSFSRFMKNIILA